MKFTFSFLPSLPCQVQIHWDANEALGREKKKTPFSHNIGHNVPQNSYFMHMQILAGLHLYFHSGNQKLKTNICIYIYIWLWKLKLSIKGEYTYTKTHTSEVSMWIFSISAHCNHHPDKEQNIPRSPVTPSAPFHCPHMPCGRLVLAWLLTAWLSVSHFWTSCKQHHRAWPLLHLSLLCLMCVRSTP